MSTQNKFKKKKKKVSRIFQRCKFYQINEYMNVLLSRHQCGFRKGYSTQQCLPALLEKWKSAVDNKKNIWCITKRRI